jgi:hypothetical protein
MDPHFSTVALKIDITVIPWEIQLLNVEGFAKGEHSVHANFWISLFLRAYAILMYYYKFTKVVNDKIAYKDTIFINLNL